MFQTRGTFWTYLQALRLLSVSVLLFVGSSPTLADTYTVTTTADPGSGTCSVSCSLHDAINAANARDGLDQIVFSIPGSGLQTIQPIDPLPAITDPVVIDGTTQSPSSTTPPIELRGDIVSANGAFEILNGADGTTIKGFIINKFPNHGISILGSQQNTIAFNWIGLDSTGLAAGRNAGSGIFLQNAPKNLIGGQGATARNVISGNGSSGIQIGFFDDGASSENEIKGNYIGTDYLGMSQVPNDGGIDVNSSKNKIGGTQAGEGNLITGYNDGYFALDLHQWNENLVYGNYIGTNAVGDASLSNNGSGSITSGINIEGGKNNRIGTPGAGNLISGTGQAIRIIGSLNFTIPESATGNLVQANYIGTNATGTAAVPNVNGIQIAGIFNEATNNTVGGRNPGEGNLISGNGVTADFGTGRAVEFNGPLTSSNYVLGNFIGVASDHITPLGNNGQAILVFTGSNNVIGEAGAGNIIAYSGQTAVTIIVGTGNKISQNSIFANGGFGIDQGADAGANPVDPGDADGGPNNLQNFPEFEVTTSGKGKVLLKGGLESTPSETFTLEFFLNDSIDDSGYGEGQTFLGSETVTTDATGIATFAKTLTATVPANGAITATSTDSLGNTSEFSVGIQLTKNLKNKLQIDRAPVVAVVDETVTVSLPFFKAPKQKKPKTKKKKRARKTSIEYELSISSIINGEVKSKGNSDARRIASKKNIVTVKDLSPGTYRATYKAKVLLGKKVTSKSKESPSKDFSVNAS